MARYAAYANVTVPAANSKSVGAQIDVPDGWISMVGIANSGTGGAGATMVPGRYFAKVVLIVNAGGAQLQGASNMHLTLWEGYLGQDKVDSLPNVRCYRGDKIECTIWGGTNAEGSAAGPITFGIMIEDLTYVPAGSFIFAQNPGDGQGEFLTQAPANPAAGADIAITVPSFVRWRLFFMAAKLTASAAVGTRATALQEQDSTPRNLTRSAIAQGTIAANQNTIFRWKEHEQLFVPDVAGTGGSVTDAKPSGAKIPAGGFIKTTTTALDVGDQWSATFLGLEEWAIPQP